MSAGSPTPLASAFDGSGAPTLLDDSQDPPLDENGRRSPRLGRGEQIGRYVILERIGAGGMGVVYAAYDSDLDRRVAIKLLRDRSVRPKDQTRLLREAQAMARLAHPNVVAVHEVGLVKGQPFVAMEYIDGQTFEQWCSATKRSWREVVAVMLEAARGLAAAHEQALVHRDFKPENVLVGNDGRTRVVDFGLARAVGDRTQEEILIEESRPSQSVRRRLTETGALAGTPAYMSPEQFRGGAPDARSDQFSFCVTLWEALYGERPFQGETRAQLALAVCSNEIRDPPPRDVPTFLRRAVQRGLSMEPEERFPSMDALAAALDRDPGRARRRVVMAGAAAAGIATLSAMAARWSTEPPDPCGGAEQRVATAWGPARQDALEASFAKVDADFAAASLTTVRDSLDEYAGRWADGYRQACEATHVRHEQSTALLDRRMACLGQRLQAMEAITELLAEADRDGVARSIRAVSALPSIEECTRTEHMMARFAPPDDAAVAEQVEQVRRQIAHAHALGMTGKASEGLAEAKAAQERAAALEFAPLLAEAHLAVAVIAVTAGQPHESLELLHAAVDAAVASGHDEVLVRASTRLVSLVGVSMSRYEEAERWARLAGAAVQRRGDEPDDVLTLERSACMMLADKGDFAAALPRCREALALSIEHYGPEHAVTGLAHRALGNAYYTSGDYPAADVEYQRSKELFLRSHGVDHPEYPALLNAVAATCYSLGRGADCVPLFAETVDAAVRSYGEEHPAVADFTNNLATVMMAEGQLDEAEKHARRSLSMRRKQFGDGHPGVGAAHRVLARIAQQRGDTETALHHVDRAVAVLEATRGADHPDVLSALETRAEVRLDDGQVEPGLADWRAALAMSERLERPPPLVAKLRFSLAKALAEHRPAQRARAVELAKAAAAEADEAVAKEIDAWLSEARSATDEPFAHR